MCAGRYDEDLYENPFFLTFQSQHKKLFDQATNERWLICVPCYEFVHTVKFTKADFEDHILIPCADEETKFNTVAGKEVFLSNDTIKTGAGFASQHEVCVLFEEVFYNDQDESYQVLCIENLLTKDKGLTESGSSSKNGEETSKIPNSYDECSNILWGHSGSRRTQENLDKALTSFANAFSRLEGETLRSIMDVSGAQFAKAMQIILKDPVIRYSARHSISYMDNLKISVETYVMHTIHKRLFRSVISCMATDDSKINKITRNLSELQLKDLGIKQQFSQNIPLARRELGKLNRYSTPLGKLFCLKRVVSAITRTPKQATTDNTDYESSLMTTDDFLPILMFLIIKSEIPNWNANLAYMRHFHFAKNTSADEYGFYLASVEAALEHIKSGQLKELLSGPESMKAEKWMQMSVNLSSDRNMTSSHLTRQDSSSNTDMTTTEQLFHYIRTGDEKSVISVLSDREVANSQFHLLLCHPLCSCDKCEKLMIQSRHDRRSATVFSRDDRGYTALHVAAAAGRSKIMDKLVQKGAVINATDYMGFTPLLLSCQKGFQGTTLMLLHLGSDPTLTDNDGNTPLHLSAANGHEDCVKALVFYDRSAMPVDVNIKNDIGDTPLHLSAKWGYESIVRVLLENGADTNIRNRKKQTPFSCAHSSHVSHLLQRAAEKSIVNSVVTRTSVATIQMVKPDGVPPQEVTSLPPVQAPRSPLAAITVSLNTSTTKMISRLLRTIADNDIPLVKFYLGWTSPSDDEDDEIDVNQQLCHPLCQCHKCQPVQKQLFAIGEGIHVNCHNADGWSPLHIAAFHNHMDLTRLFLQRHCNVNFQTRHMFTALHLACQQQNTQIIFELLDHEARVNLKDGNGNTPLHLACITGCVAAGQVLLEHGANVNVQNLQGNTPLHEAVLGNHAKVSRLLLDARARADLTNKQKLTPIQLAKDPVLQRMLLQYKFISRKPSITKPTGLPDGGNGFRRNSLPPSLGFKPDSMTISELFAAFEGKDLSTLKTLGHSVRTFNKQSRLRPTLTRDLSSPRLDLLTHMSSIKTFNPKQLRHVDSVDKSDPLYLISKENASLALLHDGLKNIHDLTAFEQRPDSHRHLETSKSVDESLLNLSDADLSCDLIDSQYYTNVMNH